MNNVRNGLSGRREPVAVVDSLVAVLAFEIGLGLIDLIAQKSSHTCSRSKRCTEEKISGAHLSQ